MENLVFILVSIGFVVGLIAYFIDRKSKLAISFESGIKNMGGLALSMIGILSLTPMFESFLLGFNSLFNRIGINIEAIISTFIAIDMGAYQIASGLGSTEEVIKFTGILISSVVGCTISFTIPVAIGIIKEKDVKFFIQGIIMGLIPIPIVLIIVGIYMKVDINIIIRSIIPISIIISCILIGILRNIDKTIYILGLLAKGIMYIGAFGLLVQGVGSILNVTLIKGLMPLDEAISIVGKIAIFLAGAYVVIEILKYIISKINLVQGEKEEILVMLIASTASAVLVFTKFDELSYKNKILLSAFSVAGAYVFGGQLAYVATVDRSSVTLYIVFKLICGVLSLILARIFIRCKDAKINNMLMGEV